MDGIAGTQPWESAGLSMSRLQIQLFGPYFSSFSAHSHGYEPSTELKSVLKLPNFRFGPDSPKGFTGISIYPAGRLH